MRYFANKVLEATFIKMFLTLIPAQIGNHRPNKVLDDVASLKFANG